MPSKRWNPLAEHRNLIKAIIQSKANNKLDVPWNSMLCAATSVSTVKNTLLWQAKRASKDGSPKLHSVSSYRNIFNVSKNGRYAGGYEISDHLHSQDHVYRHNHRHAAFRLLSLAPFTLFEPLSWRPRLCFKSYEQPSFYTRGCTNHLNLRWPLLLLLEQEQEKSLRWRQTLRLPADPTRKHAVSPFPLLIQIDSPFQILVANHLLRLSHPHGPVSHPHSSNFPLHQRQIQHIFPLSDRDHRQQSPV